MPGGVSPGLEATERVIINDMTYANGAAVVEVEVDIATGQVHILDITFSHDCGRVIHPQIVEGQVIGGIIHGIGNALFEQMSYDENAQPLSMTLAEYLLVTSTETPTRIKLLHQESPTPLNELGVKGVGETGVIPMTAAIASAVDDALSPFGARVVRTPILPHDIIAFVAGSPP